MAFIEKESKSLAVYVAPRKYTASARAAMTHILSVKKATGPRGILLPAYIGLSKIEGSGVFDPVRKTGIAYAFYRVNERLMPDLDALEAQLKTGNFQLLFLIHYFGCPQVETDSFIRLCHRYEVRVIEDCAHTLLGGLSGKRLGTFGDYAIFSIHKNTATVDGGFYLDHRGDLPDVPQDENFRIDPASLEMFANTDVLGASQQRLRNYGKVSGWVGQLHGQGLALFFDRIPEGAVPLNCPVIVADGKREALYFKLVENDIFPTALYHTLIPEISRAEFPQSHHVANNILNLPTHADISDADYADYEAILKRSVQQIFTA